MRHAVSKSQPASASIQLRLVTGLIALLSLGCGGGGSAGTGTQPTIMTAAGTVSLPAKFKLPMSELSVSTEAGAYPVNSNGSFKASVVSAGPRVVQLVDTKTNKIVFLGYVDASSSGSPFSNGLGQVSATSTADALLFIGLQGGTFPTDNWSTFISLIHGSPQEAQVAAVVTSSVAANPTAISDGDTLIENAIATVQTSYVKPRTIPTHPDSAPGISVQHVFVTRPTAATTATITSVTPDVQQGTLEITPNPSGPGIVPVSNSRRRAALFAYEVAAGPTFKTVAAIPHVEAAKDVDVEPEEEIGTFFTSILKGLQGNFAYIPVKGAPLVLNADPVQNVAEYDVVAISPAANDTFDAVEKQVAADDAEKTALDSEWSTARTHLYYKVAIKDVALPLLEELIMCAGEAKSAQADTTTESAVEAIAETLPDVEAAVASRNIRAAITAFVNDVKNDVAGIRSKVFAAISHSLIKGGFTEEFLEAAASRFEAALTITTAISKSLVVLDVTNAVYDNTAYETADLWNAYAMRPKITLTPDPAYVSSVHNITTLTATIQNETDLSNFLFKWTCTDTQGSLEEPFNSVPMPTDASLYSQAAYVGNLLKMQNGKTDTVTVTAYSADDPYTPLGSASTVVEAKPGLENGSFFYDSSDDFLGIVKNDPWVLSAVVEVPFVSGATSYIVAASGANTGTFNYFVSTKGGLQVLDAAKKPYAQYLPIAGGVLICMYGMDKLNADTPGALALLMKLYPITTVNVTFQ